MSSNCLIIWSTAPSAEKAKEISDALVSERLCACVNIVSGVQSIFRWQDKIQNDPEVLMIIKSTQECYPQFRTTDTRTAPL